jgi:hypothetical protein
LSASSAGKRGEALVSCDQKKKGKSMDEEPRRKNDKIAKIYIATGVPGIILFIVVIFAFSRSCGIAA